MTRVLTTNGKYDYVLTSLLGHFIRSGLVVAVCQ